MPDITGDGVNDYDITPAGSQVTIGGVVFTDAVNTGSGTGNYNTFLAISNNRGVESGFNSDDTPPIDASNSDIDQAKTHTVLLSSLVVVTINGVQYYEFRVDLNEANSDPNAQISLDQFKLYSSSNGGINDLATLQSQNLIYDMDAGGNVSVLLSDAESSGSGTDDYAVLVPVTEFAGLDPTTTYVYLYAQMGAAGSGWTAGATFEEWNLQNGVALSGTKFEDVDGDGIKDAGEGPVAGVTIFIDANKNGVYDAGERTTVTDANGNYIFYGVATGQTVWIDEIVPAGSTQTTGDHETVVIGSTASGTIVVDPIGNFIPHPSYTVTKVATSITGGTGANGLDGADSDGDVVHYNIVVTNTGNVTLTGYSINDPNADSLSYVSGDDGDGLFEAGESWVYSATHIVDQSELDNQGTDNTGAIDGDGDTDNTVYVHTTNAGDHNASDDTPLIYNPDFDVTKTATSIDGGQGVDGLGGADSDGDVVNYSILVENTGNITLTGFQYTDDNADAGSISLVSGDTDMDGNLDVGESWVFSATHTVSQDELDNQGTASDGSYDGDGDTDNTVTVEFDQVGPKDGSDDTPLIYNPDFDVTKTATSIDGGQGVDGLGGADSDGDVVNYSILVENTGNITLTGFQYTDDNADAGSISLVSGDTDMDGNLDVGESWVFSATHTVSQDELDNQGTASDGSYDGDGDTDNTVTVEFDQAGPKDGSDDTPLIYNPDFAVTKTATSIDGGQGVDGLGGADSDGDVVNYSILVENTGNITLTGFQYTDDNADAGSISLVSGDTDMDGNLDVGESWVFSATHTVSQDELDNQGTASDGSYDGDGDTDNTVTVEFDQAGPKDGSDDTPLIYNPDFAVTKTATSIDGGQGVDGLGGADSDGDVVNYSILVENTGNITLTGFQYTDDNADAGSISLVSGDTDMDGNLDVGESWVFSATHTVSQDELDNQGTASDGSYDGDGDTDNTVTVEFDQAGPKDGSDDTPLIYNPDFAVTKTATSIDGGQGVDGLGGADSDGDVVNYSILVENTGNITLTGFQYTDDNADAGSISLVSGDTDMDGNLDVGESWVFSATHTVSQDELDNQGTASDGSYDGDGDTDNTVTVEFDQVGPKDGSDDTPLIYNPDFDVTKTATSIDGGQGVDGLGGADSDGDVVNYSILVENTGNITLTGFQYTDDNADAGSISLVSGDTDMDGNLDVGESWVFSATHTVSQDELDNQGTASDGSYDGDGDTDNTVTVEFDQAGPKDGSDDTPLIYNPLIDLEKYVSVDSTNGINGTFVDADDALGPQNVNIGSRVWFHVTLENTGNITLTDVDVVDLNTTTGLPGTSFDLLVDGQLTLDAVNNHFATLDGDTDGDHFLDVGETWTITYADGFDPGNHVNTATVTTDEGATDSDDAHYYSLIEEGPGVRTPGFWTNLGAKFWDNIQGNEPKQAGTPCFPDGELLYAVDSNHDGVINGSDQAGLLIGDYNQNGLTDVGEDTLFMSLADAKTLINASNKTVGGDGRFMLGRDMVATWLNYLAGNGIGDAADTQSPHHYMDDAIDWMQIYSGATNGGTSELFDRFMFGTAIKTSTSAWKDPQSGIDHSAAAMHSALDYYNNHGQTMPGGTIYAHSCDDPNFILAIQALI